ncbi:hypothetical protein GHT06_012321 [Daphnia sinensis]|uniref:bis(5'-adenosyl)-triphosphatase n=1 Tax=Daphnia sinensis TaxID=1820382 RepID=A0AAD5KVG6_9CRUS|nr:hypothetical protein GHT06_012321 [Daphnia sinensis]
MSHGRQLTAAFFSVVVLLCSGPVLGRFGQHDGDGHDLGHHGKYAVAHAGHRLERAVVPDYTTSRKQIIGKNEDVICLPLSPALPLPEDNATFTFGQANIQGWAIFYQSKYSVAFVKPKCVVPGHVLVMPLKSTKRILDMQPEELADLFLTAQHVQRGMELFHGVSSSMIAVQDGPDAGQSIQHVHVHIMPRRPNDFKENDEVYDELNKRDKEPAAGWRTKEEMKKEADELRQFFKSL